MFFDKPRADLPRERTVAPETERAQTAGGRWSLISIQ